MGDIDNFKKINDQFGHQIGDEILKMFARVLTDNVHTRDTVARYGGEEFAIILPETRLESARQLTERMRSQVEGMELAVSESGREIGKVTASFGIAELGPGRRCRRADPARRRQALRGQVRRPQPRCRGPGRRRVTRLTPWVSACAGTFDLLPITD